MNKRPVKLNSILDYSIGVLSVLILILGTFLMPQLYSTITDKKDLNKSHVIEREEFAFKNPIKMTVYEQVQQLMENISQKKNVKRTLYLTKKEMTDDQLIERVRESLDIITQYKLISDISAYDLENNVVYAEYYNLNDSAQDSGENAFWVIRFSDKNTFDLTVCIDATEYIIYQVELYCAESADYALQLTSDDNEVVEFLNTQFKEGCLTYFEAEAYELLSDVLCPDMVLMMGYERGEYAIFRTPCSYGYIGGQGMRWGFVPMTVAMESNSVSEVWGYKQIVSYYKDLYDIDIYDPVDTKK